MIQVVAAYHNMWTYKKETVAFNCFCFLAIVLSFLKLLFKIIYRKENQFCF